MLLGTTRSAVLEPGGGHFPPAAAPVRAQVRAHHLHVLHLAEATARGAEAGLRERRVDPAEEDLPAGQGWHAAARAVSGGGQGGSQVPSGRG